MRCISLPELMQEDMAFTQIETALNTWKYGDSTHFNGTGRPENLFCFMLEGTRSYRLPGTQEPLTVYPGDLLLMPTGSCYETTVTSEAGVRGINIKFALTDSEGTCCCLGRELTLLRHPVSESLRALIHETHACSLQYGSRLRVKRLMMELLIALCEAPGISASEELQPALRYMSEHLEKPVSVNEMAGLCHMSQSTFARRFREMLSESPAAYHRGMRLKKGRELLKSGLYTVEQAGQTVGFYDAAHFGRAYRALFGEYPTDAREKLLRK